MIELQKAKIESWQNLNKEDYDLFVEMKGQEKLTILLDTEDVHYKSVYHLKSLQQESMPFSSISDMFSHLQECKANPQQGQLILMEQKNVERKSFVLMLQKPEQQLAELRWQTRKKFKKSDEQLALLRREVSILKQQKESRKQKLIHKKTMLSFPLEQKKETQIKRSSVEDEGRQNIQIQSNMGQNVPILARIKIQPQTITNSLTLRNILKADEATSIQKIRHLESEIDEDTPWERNFRCRGNTITLNDSEPKKDRTQRWQQQILLRTVIEEPLTFQARINCGKEVIVGIVDRRKQRERSSSYRSGNAICYSSLGEIWFNQKGRAKVEKTDDQLTSGSELVIKVAPKEGSVHFTVRDRLGTRRYPVPSQILQQEDREFVPYFEMMDIGDSIEWQIIKEEYLSVQNEQSHIQDLSGLLKQLTSHSKSSIEKVLEEDDQLRH